MNRDALIDRLASKGHEDCRLKPYTDTAGKLTIGIGRNLTDVGLRPAEARYLCEQDVIAVEGELDAHVAWWRTLDETRQQVLAEMCFNLGWPRLSGFRQMLADLQAGNFAGAADEMLASAWAGQVGQRARVLAAAMRAGAF
jgi:lysozyme